jgi:hypothetical protein
MNAHAEIDREIRRLTDEGTLSRPFVCDGSPIGCDVAEVGINPGTDTPFWPYWCVETGFDKVAWLGDYTQRNGRLKPTRDRIEVLCAVLKPLRCLELNLYHRYSRNESSLEKEYRDTELFDFMLSVAKPRVLLVHGSKPIEHVARMLGVSIEKDTFTPAVHLDIRLEVFAAVRHFAYVSRNYVASVGEKIKARALELRSERAGS